MRSKAYQDKLIDIIAEQTGQKREIVSSYVMAQFEEIEKLLSKTSNANVDGLGVFRVMKTSSAKKVLFIPKFEDLDEIEKAIMSKDEVLEKETSDSSKTSTQKRNTTTDTSHITSPITNNTNPFESTSAINTQSTPSTDESDLAETDIYKEWDDMYTDNKKRNTWIIIAVIIIAALAGVFLFNIM